MTYARQRSFAAALILCALGGLRLDAQSPLPLVGTVETPSLQTLRQARFGTFDGFGVFDAQCGVYAVLDASLDTFFSVRLSRPGETLPFAYADRIRDDRLGLGPAGGFVVTALLEDGGGNVTTHASVVSADGTVVRTVDGQRHRRFVHDGRDYLQFEGTRPLSEAVALYDLDQDRLLLARSSHADLRAVQAGEARFSLQTRDDTFVTFDIAGRPLDSVSVEAVFPGQDVFFAEALATDLRADGVPDIWAIITRFGQTGSELLLASAGSDGVVHTRDSFGLDRTNVALADRYPAPYVSLAEGDRELATYRRADAGRVYDANDEPGVARFYEPYAGGAYRSFLADSVIVESVADRSRLHAVPRELDRGGERHEFFDLVYDRDGTDEVAGVRWAYRAVAPVGRASEMAFLDGNLEPLATAPSLGTNLVRDFADGVAYFYTFDRRPLGEPETYSIYRLGSVVPAEQTAAAADPLRLAPNPAAETIRLDLPPAAGLVEVVVVDAQGRVRLRLPGLAPGSPVDLRALAAGSYRVLARYEDGRRAVGVSSCGGSGHLGER